MQGRFWKFVKNGKNREILSWLGGGLVVVIAGLWAAVVYLFPAHKPAEARGGDLNASCGSVAIGGNATGVTINQSGPNADCTAKAQRGAKP
jgi:hypothetical protein